MSDGDGTGNADTVAADAAAAAAATAAAAAAASGTQNGAQPGSEADKGSSAAAAQTDPFGELETDTLTWFDKRHGKDPAKAVKQAYELDKLIGKSIVIPDETATDEQKADFRKKLGVPEKEDGYAFKVPENLPPELPYDGERDKAFAKVCLDAGIPVAQANALRDWYIKTEVEGFGGVAEKMKGDLKATIQTETAKLVSEWGPNTGETFKANVEFADRFFTAVDKDGELKGAIQKAGWLGPEGEILNAAMAKAFANAGRAVYQEDGQLRGNAEQLTNPFKKGAEFNLTQAGQLVRNDPAKARSFILAAGRKPSEFGMTD